METIEATIRRVIYNADDFYILSLRGGKTAKGSLAVTPCAGDSFEFHGEWKDNPKYGLQFEIAGATIPEPREASAVVTYLQRVCEGIGSVRAQEIVNAFGEDAIEVLKSEPERIAEETTVSRTIAIEAGRSLRDNASMEETVLQLEKLLGGLAISKAVKLKLAKRFGGTFAEAMRSDPYVLAGISGVGFHTADKVAKRVGIEGDDYRRVRAGIYHVLEEAAQRSGHTNLPRGVVLESALTLLSVDEGKIDVEIDSCIENQAIVSSPEGLLATAHLFDREAEIAERLAALVGEERVGGANVKVSGAESLNERQSQACSVASEHRVMVLTGGPGTGKTYTLKAILSLYAGKKVALCAPTGKAAKRMSESTGRPANTIHKMLNARPAKGEDGELGFSFEFGETTPLPCDVVVLDEASMLDVNLTVSLLRAIKPGTRLVLIGDSDQLPSIGPGSVLRDVIASGVVPCVELTEVMRQSEEGGLIVQACQDIRQGSPPKTENLEGGDLFFARVLDRQQAAASIVSFAAERLPKALNVDPLRDIQVITALRKKTELGADSLNLLLQDALNKNPKIDGTKFRLGDKVIQTKRDPALGLMNGDICFIVNVDRDEKALHLRRFEDDDDAEVIEVPWKTNNLDLGYAVTVHKFQGSESPIVIAPVHPCAGPLLMQRNWLYTAISRARDVCVLVGDEKAAADAVQRTSAYQRITRLEGLLRSLVEAKAEVVA